MFHKIDHINLYQIQISWFCSAAENKFEQIKQRKLPWSLSTREVNVTSASYSENKTNQPKKPKTPKQTQKNPNNKTQNTTEKNSKQNESGIALALQRK